ncbi:MAG: hypothetical protein L0312_21280, partial [Acidobacteria bacterium]|nr:hypothetical protein [Acidobacteriota bacterium]
MTKTLSPFPIEWLELPDAGLGKSLLGYRILAQSLDLGDINPELLFTTPEGLELFSRIVEQLLATPGVLEQAGMIVESVLQKETDTANLAALEKALHLAARGEYARGGKIFREHLINGAKHIADARHAATGRKVLKSARKGHEAVHGTKEEKEARWKILQGHIDSLRKQYPDHTHHKLCEIAAAEGKASKKTYLR